jgi:sigma-54 specific flagellar transcriptional regulator A
MWRDIQVLVIDDDAERQHDLTVILDFLGEASVCTPCSDWQKAASLQARDGRDFVAVMLGDSEMPLTERMAELHRWDPSVPVILLGQRQMDDGLELELRYKIVASLGVPPSYNKLLDTLHRCQVYREQYALNQRGGQQQKEPLLFQSLVGSSRGIAHVREMMTQVADKDVTVLITGESGTGKEVVARNLHDNSPRRDKPFVPVNCGAIPPELLESELFGHEKGAFTGAVNSRAGRFELAEGGTLFLDEIGDMPLHMQVKILRVLQERCYERVGGSKTLKTDVRIIAATHRNLEQMIEQGAFREDLYYRLNVFPIEIPSVRERAEDIPLLIHELVSRLERERRGSIRFNSAAVMSLCRHEWPGNVRELANLVERMAIMNPFAVVGVRDLPKKFRHVDESDEEPIMMPQGVAMSSAGLSTMESNVSAGMPDSVLLPINGINMKDYLGNLEISLIEQALGDCNGVVARAADRLQIRRTTLVEKMRKYGIDRGEDRLEELQ